MWTSDKDAQAKVHWLHLHLLTRALHIEPAK